MMLLQKYLLKINTTKAPVVASDSNLVSKREADKLVA